MKRRFGVGGGRQVWNEGRKVVPVLNVEESGLISARTLQRPEPLGSEILHWWNCHELWSQVDLGLSSRSLLVLSMVPWESEPQRAASPSSVKAE